MKKTLLSVLAGLTVIGSASAAPTPEDRKALCQLLIDKGTHVWVEKTKACIPVNPCLSDDEQIKKAYCFEKTLLGISLDDDKKVDLWLNKFAEQCIKSKMVEKICLLGSEYEWTKMPDNYISIKTADGGYYTLHMTYFYNENGKQSADSVVTTAAEAYCANPEHSLNMRDILIDKKYEGICKDVMDFAKKLMTEPLNIRETDVSTSYPNRCGIQVNSGLGEREIVHD